MKLQSLLLRVLKYSNNENINKKDFVDSDEDDSNENAEKTTSETIGANNSEKGEDLILCYIRKNGTIFDGILYIVW